MTTTVAATHKPMDRDTLLEFHEEFCVDVAGRSIHPPADVLIADRPRYLLGNLTASLGEVAAHTKAAGRAPRKVVLDFAAAVVKFAAFAAPPEPGAEYLTPGQYGITIAVQLFTDSREVMRQKNHDYAGGADTSTPFANFTLTESVGITTTELGFLVRLSDKLSRLRTFVDGHRLQVRDEGVRDTLIDALNYAVLYLAYVTDQEAAGRYRAKAMPAPDPVRCRGCDRGLPVAVGSSYCDACIRDSQAGA